MMLSFIVFASILGISLSQVNYCIWNIVNKNGTSGETSYTSANGLYEYKGEYEDFRKYYLNNDTSCGDPLPDGNYLYYKTKIDGKWRLGLSDPNLDEYNIVNGVIGQCTKDVQPSTPNGCEGKWAIPSDQLDSNIQVTIGDCPNWAQSCSQISISTSAYPSCQVYKYIFSLIWL